VGCTIDAGAKIYAGRVDAVHSDILKMLGTMGSAETEDDNEKGWIVIQSIYFQI
jgi:condensin complex subunit 2